MSDGTVVPKGVTICVNDRPVTLDPEFYEKPEEFDPFRAYRQRQTVGQESQHQFVMVDKARIFLTANSPLTYVADLSTASHLRPRKTRMSG
jgi:cytochrome P450